MGLQAGRKGGGEILKRSHRAAPFVTELRAVKGLRQWLMECFHRGFTCSHTLLLKPRAEQPRSEKGNRNCGEGSEGARGACASAGNGNLCGGTRLGEEWLIINSTLGEEGMSGEQRWHRHSSTGSSVGRFGMEP